MSIIEDLREHQRINLERAREILAHADEYQRRCPGLLDWARDVVRKAEKEGKSGKA